MRKLVAATLLLSACYSTEENLGFTVVGEPRWAIGLGSRGNDRGFLTAFDSIGDVVVSGEVWENTDVATGNIWYSSFITKRVASDGAERWTLKLRSLTSASSAWIGAMAVTSNDDIVVCGSYVGSVDFGGQSLSLVEPSPPDHGDMFVARYHSDGTLVWVRGLSEYSNVQPDALVVGSDDTLYVAGHFWHGSVVLDGHEYREDVGDWDTVLLAYHGDGSLRWFHVLQGPGNTLPRSMALAPNGDLLIAGSFIASASFGGAVINADARLRSFFARYRSDGLYLESRSIGPASPWMSDDPRLAVDASGQIVLQQIETDESQSVSNWDARRTTVRVFAEDGTEKWFSRLPNNGDVSPQSRTLLTTVNGLIASSAWTDEPYAVDNRGSVSGEMEVMTFDAAGSESVSSFASRVWAAPQATIAWSSTASPSGAIAFTGQFGGKIDFGMGPIATHGQDDADVFIVVMNPPVANCDASPEARRLCGAQ